MQPRFSKNFSDEEIKKRTDRIKKAREKFAKERSLNTKENDKILRKHIYTYPGKTPREIEEFFSVDQKQKEIFVRSYLLNALKRLESDDAVYFQTEEKQGKIIKRYFYKHVDLNQDKILLTITELERIFNHKFTALKSEIQISALTYNTICVALSKNQEIINESLFSEIPKINLIKNQVEIYFPKKIIDFYLLHKRNFYMIWKCQQNQINLELKTIPKQIVQVKKKIQDVIILEDDKDYREILEEGLQEAGYNPIPCKDDIELLEKIDEIKNIDYFVADDEIKGTKIARAIFFILQKKFPNVKAGLISGASRNDVEEKALLDAGFTCIFQKGKPKKRNTKPTEICKELIEHLEELSHD